MDLTAIRAKAAVASLLNRRGVTVTANGSPLKMIVDERLETVAKAVPQDIFDTITGRVAIFHTDPDDGVKAGDALTYDNQWWTVHPVRLVASEGSEILRSFLATAGAVR